MTFITTLARRKHGVEYKRKPMKTQLKTRQNAVDKQIVAGIWASFSARNEPLSSRHDKLMFSRSSLATLTLLLLCASSGFAQQGFSAQPGVVHGGSAQGSVTVTATVVASVGVVIGPDGEQKLVFANAADPSDNVSRLQSVRTVALTSNRASSTADSAPKKKKKH